MKVALLEQHSKENISLTLREIEKPNVKENQVLVKVSAVGVNPLDNMIIRGEVKLITPYKLPQVLGNELVGVVYEIGKDAKKFKKGDRVFTRLPLDNIGAFSEYVAVDEDALAFVPDYLTDEQAASVPLTSLTIIQALDLMNVKAGETIFISGGTGSVGAMAIPIAREYGLKVITSGSLKNKERVLDLGVSQFIDYKTENYVDVLSDVDYVLDTLGGKETEKQFSILKQGGHLVSLKGMPNGKFAKRMNLSWWKKILFSLAGKKFDKLAAQNGVTYDFIFVESDGKGLSKVSEILDKLKIKPQIDSIYSIDEVNEALAKVDKGGLQGKVIVKF